MSSTCQTLSNAVEISNWFHDPVNLHFKDKHCGQFYHRFPIGARVTFVAFNLIQGIVKPLFFILTSLFWALALPLIGAYKGLKGERGVTVEYVAAGALNLVGFVAVGAFFVVSAYYLPLAASASIYLAATVFCIIVHIKRAADDPTIMPASSPSHSPPSTPPSVGRRLSGGGGPPSGMNGGNTSMEVGVDNGHSALTSDTKDVVHSHSNGGATNGELPAHTNGGGAVNGNHPPSVSATNNVMHSDSNGGGSASGGHPLASSNETIFIDVHGDTIPRPQPQS